MDTRDKTINKLLEIESHEMKELRLLLQIVRTSNPDIYKVTKEPLLKIMTETVDHVEEFFNYVDELRRG